MNAEDRERLDWIIRERKGYFKRADTDDFDWLITHLEAEAREVQRLQDQKALVSDMLNDASADAEALRSERDTLAKRVESCERVSESMNQGEGEECLK